MERYCRTIHRDPLCDTYQRLQLRENSCCTLESVPPMLMVKTHLMLFQGLKQTIHVIWVGHHFTNFTLHVLKLDQNKSQFLYFQLFVYVVLEAGAWWSSCSWCPDPGILTIHLEIRGETWLAISPSPPTLPLPRQRHSELVLWWHCSKMMYWGCRL